MRQNVDVMMDTPATEYDKEAAQGEVGYFSSPKDLLKQQRNELKQIRDELNRVVSVMGKEFEICTNFENKHVLYYLRIDCEGMDKKVIKDFSQKLKECGLDAHRYHQQINSNLGFMGASGSFIFIAVKSKKNETFKVSDELCAFAENHPAKRSACCNIL